MPSSARRLLITVPAGVLFGVLLGVASDSWGLVGVGLIMGVGTGLAWSALAPAPVSQDATPSVPGDSMDP